MNDALTQSQMSTLRAIADVIIPPAPQYDVPGAGDESICAAIVIDAAAKLVRLASALDAADAMAQDVHGRAMQQLDEEQRLTLAHEFRDRYPHDAQLLEVLVAQCYYRDPRVVRSLGLEARPPHPQGYELEQGDWSLLEPVRRLDPIFRS